MADSSLLLSLVGIAGTLAGGGLTSFTSARLERRKEASADRQQQRQDEATERAQERELKVEHYRWRRDRRQAAYVDFFAKAQDLLFTFAKVNSEVGSENGNSERRHELLNEAHEAVSALHLRTAVVMVEGPMEVSHQAALIHTRLTLLVSSASSALKSTDPAEAARHTRELNESIESLSQAQGAFLTAAQSALDEVVRSA